MKVPRVFFVSFPAKRVTNVEIETGCEVIVAGHSHMFAMGAPQRYQGPLALVPFQGRCGFLMEEWKGNRSNEYWDALVGLSANRSALIIFNGNQHHADFLLAPDP